MHEQTNNRIAEIKEWQGFLKANPDIEAVDAFIIDVNGNAVGKRLPVSDADKIFTQGVQFSASALSRLIAAVSVTMPVDSASRMATRTVPHGRWPAHCGARPGPSRQRRR